MRTLLTELDYDFSRFTMEGFTRWLEERRGRRIFFVPRTMPPTLFGAWLAGPDDDYIFYEANTLAIHQAHIQLHEIAHILCDHPAAQIGPQEVQILLRQANIDPTLYQFFRSSAKRIETLLLRSTHSDEAEQEAETLTALIQEQVLRHVRLRELTRVISSDEDLAAYIRAMELV